MPDLTKQQVVTQKELDNIVLKLAKCSSQADVNGLAIMEIDIPGDVLLVQRYAASGVFFTSNYGWNDCIKKIEIIDKPGNYGQGTNAVLKVYHDSEVPDGQQGWYFELSSGTEGKCEIKPVGWYGELYGSLTVRVTLNVQPNAYIKGNIWWSKKES